MALDDYILWRKSKLVEKLTEDEAEQFEPKLQLGLDRRQAAHDLGLKIFGGCLKSLWFSSKCH